MSARKILIVSGEPSGDLHAADLVRNIKKIDPECRFYGTGGELSRSAGVETLSDIASLSVIGVVEVIRHAGPIKKAFSAILDRVDREKPDLAILVDYPGFNLRLARQLKARSIPTVYYISPQVWAWGADRVNTIKECVKRVYVLFKFEEEFYKKRGVDAEFIGNPLTDTVRPDLGRNDVLKKYGLSDKKKTICLLPGSRPGEMHRLLRPMLGAARVIKERLDNVQFVASKFRELPREFFEKAILESGVDVSIVEGDTYNILSASDFAIVTSGTATLETALVGTPFVITYKTNPITWAIAKRIVQVKYVGIVNIVAGRAIVPEVLQYEATPEGLAAACLDILQDDKKLSQMRSDLASLRKLLGPSGASSRAAASIVGLLNKKP